MLFNEDKKTRLFDAVAAWLRDTTENYNDFDIDFTENEVMVFGENTIERYSIFDMGLDEYGIDFL